MFFRKGVSIMERRSFEIQPNKQIHQICVEESGYERKPFSTLIRKSAVSKVHTTNHSNEEQGNLADLMAHNVNTARKFYRLQEKSKSSVKASQNLRIVMRGKEGNSPARGLEECAPIDASLPKKKLFCNVFPDR